LNLGEGGGVIFRNCGQAGTAVDRRRANKATKNLVSCAKGGVAPLTLVPGNERTGVGGPTKVAERADAKGPAPQATSGKNSSRKAVEKPQIKAKLLGTKRGELVVREGGVY